MGRSIEPPRHPTLFFLCVFFTACDSADVRDNFVTYPAYNILGYNLALDYLGSGQACRDLCLANPSCRTAEFNGNACNQASATFLDVPETSKVLGTNPDWTHWQRTCA